MLRIKFRVLVIFLIATTAPFVYSAALAQTKEGAKKEGKAKYTSVRSDSDDDDNAEPFKGAHSFPEQDMNPCCQAVEDT